MFIVEEGEENMNAKKIVGMIALLIVVFGVGDF